MKIDSAVGTGMTAAGSGFRSLSAEYVYVFPVTFAQQRLLFLNQLDPNSTSYSVPWSIRMTGRLNVEALERSLNEIVSRHEILRTTFDVIDGQPVQIVSPSLHVPLPVVDYPQRPDPEREAREAGGNGSADARGPEKRARGAYHASASRARTTTCFYSPCTTSFLMAGRVAYWWVNSRRCTTHSAPAVRRRCRNFLCNMPIMRCGSGIICRERTSTSCWTTGSSSLRALPATLDLPTDRPRPAVQSFRGAVESFAFPETLSDEVRQCQPPIRRNSVHDAAGGLPGPARRAIPVRTTSW